MGRTIRVTGKGKLSVKPDLIRLRIIIEEIQSDYEKTLKLSAEYTELLKDMFENLGFNRKDLKTLFFNVDTEYESYRDSDNNWKRRFEGYKFIHKMKIEFHSDNEMLGKVLYALARCPINPEFTIEYTIADPEKSKNELLGKAVEDSKAKAEVLTKSAGVSLGEIELIDYSWGEIEFISRPVDEMMIRCCEEASVTGPGAIDIDIEADDIDVSDTVTVVWNII